MTKRFLLFLSIVGLSGILTYFFYPSDSKQKHCMHDEATYLHFCAEVVAQPSIYATFRSHPLYSVFQENLNEETAKQCFGYLQTQYPHLLQERTLIACLSAIGKPPKMAREDGGEIALPSLRNLKIAGDVEKFFGSLSGKKIVQIGASDGELCKILMTLHQPAQYCIVDMPPALALAKKTLADWGIHNIELCTPEDYDSTESIDLVISSFVFAESTRKTQEHYIQRIMRYARHGYLECRFPMRHFGLKVWSPEQILSHLQSIEKCPQLLKEDPLTDIDYCLILFGF